MRNSKLEKCTIVGTHHEYEYEDLDKLKKGKRVVFDVLTQINPDLIIIEQGYYDKLLNEFGGRPANDDNKKRIKEKHWAALWGKTNDTEVVLADLRENLEKDTSREDCCSKRENAISNEIIQSIARGYKNIILFCGKDHVNEIMKRIEEHADVNAVNMNVIEKENEQALIIT